MKILSLRQCKLAQHYTREHLNGDEQYTRFYFDFSKPKLAKFKIYVKLVGANNFMISISDNIWIRNILWHSNNFLYERSTHMMEQATHQVRSACHAIPLIHPPLQLSMPHANVIVYLIPFPTIRFSILN